VIFERALLYRRNDEGIAIQAADERFNLLRTAAFEAQNTESRK
jgi:hypothetical protein